MSNSVTPPLQQLEDTISEAITHLHDFTYRPQDFTRNRKLPIDKLLKTILNMQGQSLNTELLNAFPDMDQRMTASAFDQAKGKLKPEIFEYIFHQYNNTVTNLKTLDKSLSYRLYAIDGSDFNVPYDPNSPFVVDYNSGRPKADGTDPKPFCMVHANMLYDLLNRQYMDCVLQPKTKRDERDAALKMIYNIPNDEPYIVIMDRGYTGFNFIEHLNRIPNCYYIIRTKISKGAIAEIQSLPDDDIDEDMTFRVTTSGHYFRKHRSEEKIHLVPHINKHYKEKLSKTTRDQRWDFEQFCNIHCRIVKFKINEDGKDNYEVLITNLNRFEFPFSDMKEMYHKRWGIETSFLELKYALGAVNFHSKRPDFIVMELYAHFIMFNVVARYVSQTKLPANKTRKYDYAIDFKMACQIIRKYYKDVSNYKKIPLELIGYTIPIRPDRKDFRKAVRPKTAIWFVYRVA